MYFQCDPTENVDAWSDDRIWEQQQARLAGEDGFRLNEGKVLEKTVLPFRSFVQEPMRYGNLLLADVRVLAEVLERAPQERRRRPLRVLWDEAAVRRRYGVGRA